MIFSHRSLRDRDVLRNAALAMLLVSFVAATTASGATDAPAPTVSAAFETGAVHAGATARANVNVIFAEGWHVNAHKPNDEYLIPTDLKIDPPTGIAVRETTYPEPEKMVLEGTGETLLTYGPKFSIGIMFDIAPDVQPGEHTINGVLEYQACDKKQCYPPNSIPVTWTVNVISATQSLAPQPTQSPKEPNTSTSTNIPNPIPQTPYPNADWIPLANAFTVAGDASGYLNATDFIAFLDEVETGRGMAGKNSLVGQTGWLVVVFAIVGGLLLNLTPCVLPLIPINLGIIGAGAKAGSRGRGFLLGGTYGTGIAITYGVLGLVVILGVSKTFGAINATPWFNAGIAIVFTALALAMFDVYLLDFTRFQTRLGFRKGGGHFTAAFVMGAVSALLAGACVAPVIISTIVYAQDRYANGVWAALFLPFLVGVGMALPWPFAGAGLSFLPKPGAWMVRVKQAFGVLILLFAAYYAHLAYDLVRARHADGELAGWTPSIAEGLARAQREQKPVFIDFWATWCKNCTMMDKTTFLDPDVQKRMAGYVKIKFQAERPSDPDTRKAMEHFGVVGLPTYMVLKPPKP